MGGKAFSYAFVKKYVESNGFTFMSDEYINSKHKIICKCSNNHVFKVRFDHFRKKAICKYCTFDTKKKNIEDIRNIMLEEKYILLEHVYVNKNYKMKCICGSGHQYKTSWVNWKRGKRCQKCYVDEQRYDLEFVKDSFDKEKYTLISKEYINNRLKLKYKCRFGHYGEIRFDSWLSGNRCRVCFHLNNSGDNNPSWKGGISAEPYCEIWLDKDYKESIKERDGHSCLNPDCFKVSNNLVLHHIDYIKKNCHPLNLITLCRSCNTRANKDREWHAAFYKEILRRRGIL